MVFVKIFAWGSLNDLIVSPGHYFTISLHLMQIV